MHTIDFPQRDISGSRELFLFWKITNDILDIVQERDNVAVEE